MVLKMLFMRTHSYETACHGAAKKGTHICECLFVNINQVVVAVCLRTIIKGQAVRIAGKTKLISVVYASGSIVMRVAYGATIMSTEPS